jgi:ribulose bisphosphate carboxylase small subunit
MGSISYLQAIKPDTGKIHKLIENGLLYDWIIRIEYASVESEHAQWYQWNETFFALSSADSVIAALKACYAKNLHCTIRINAEKVRPRSCMLYTVYAPQFLPAEAIMKPLTSRLKYPGEQDYTSAPARLITRN